MVRVKRNKIARIKALWSTAYSRGWKKSMDFWRIQAAKELEIQRMEYEQRLSLERKRHIEEESRILSELYSIQGKFRVHRENMNRIQNVGNILMTISSNLQTSVGMEFARAAAAVHEIDMAILQDRKLIKKHGDVA